MNVDGMMAFCEELLKESVRRATGQLSMVLTKTDPRVLGFGSAFDVTLDFSAFATMSMENALVTHIPVLMDWYFRLVRPRLAEEISDWLLFRIGANPSAWLRTGANSRILLAQFNWLASFDNLMNQVIDLNEYDEPSDVPDEEAASRIKAHLNEISEDLGATIVSSMDFVANVVETFESHIEQVVGVENTADGMILRPTFIVDFPKSISPLSKASPENPLVAERFELFINGMEIANGFSELNDPKEQYERFVDQMSLRTRGDEEAMILDEDYIRALSYGMPPAAGIGIGIDRLVMLLTNRHSIRDVILFPHMRPERRDEEKGSGGEEDASEIS
jgi:lysyl-tRNA synthetase class II